MVLAWAKFPIFTKNYTYAAIHEIFGKKYTQAGADPLFLCIQVADIAILHRK